MSRTRKIFENAALSWLTGFEEGKKIIFFQFYDPIPLVNISNNIHSFSFSAAGEASENQRERKYFIKESEFNVNGWHSYYQVIWGQWASLGLGIPPSCHWETHTSCWTQAEMKMPLCFSALGAKGHAVPCLYVFSRHLGEVWQTSMDHSIELWIRGCKEIKILGGSSFKSFQFCKQAAKHEI